MRPWSPAPWNLLGRLVMWRVRRRRPAPWVPGPGRGTAGAGIRSPVPGPPSDLLAGAEAQPPADLGAGDLYLTPTPRFQPPPRGHR